MESRFLVPLLIVWLVSFQACSQEKPAHYPAYIGDVEFDPVQDDAGFKICNPHYIAQYYNFGKGVQFNGEKSKIIDHFKKYYQANRFAGENGYVKIRFIVNCEGYSGRFRAEEMDFNLEPKAFGKGMTKELLKITSNLHGWTVATYETNAFDYYQHLTFKIEDGKITEIMP